MTVSYEHLRDAVREFVRAEAAILSAGDLGGWNALVDRYVAARRELYVLGGLDPKLARRPRQPLRESPQ